MRKVLMIATIALIAVACNKNQAAVRKLDGTWKATTYNYTEDGVTINLLGAGFITGATFDFEGCKLKDDEFCNVTTTISTILGADSETGLYNVTNDGETLQIKDDPSSTTINAITIDDLTNSALKINWTDIDGYKTEITLEK